MSTVSFEGSAIWPLEVGVRRLKRPRPWERGRLNWLLWLKLSKPFLLYGYILECSVSNREGESGKWKTFG